MQYSAQILALSIRFVSVNKHGMNGGKRLSLFHKSKTCKADETAAKRLDVCKKDR